MKSIAHLMRKSGSHPSSLYACAVLPFVFSLFLTLRTASAQSLFVPPIVATTTTTLSPPMSTSQPNRAGIDRAGNIYVVVAGTLEVIPAFGAGTPVQLVTGFKNSFGNSVVIDAAGNLWASAPQTQSLTNNIYGVMLFIPAANGVPDLSSFGTPQAYKAVESTKCVIGAQQTQPCVLTLYDMSGTSSNCSAGSTTAQSPQVGDFTVDANGYVYFIDTYDYSSSGKYYRIVKVNPLGSTTYSKGVILADNLSVDNVTSGQFSQVVLDGAGNLFYMDGTNGSLYQVSNTSCSLTAKDPKVPFASGISTDIYGNLYVSGNTAISEVPFEGSELNFQDEFGIANTLSSAINLGGAVDRHGNLIYQASTNLQRTEVGGHNFGSVQIGSSVAGSTAPTVQLFFNAPETITENFFPSSSPPGNTSGQLLQSFPDTGVSTVNPGQAISAGTSVSVAIAFEPVRAGLLRGAYTPRDSSGANLTVIPVQGNGIGPELVVSSGTSSGLFNSAANTVGSNATQVNLSMPSAIAVDSYGDVFVVDSGNARVVADCLASTTTSVAGDASGHSNSFCTTAGYNNAVVALPFTFTDPTDVAVDGANDLFVLDAKDGSVTEVQASNLTSNSAVPAGTLFGGVALSGPKGLLLDGYGDLYIADTGNNRIVVAHRFGAQTTQNQVYVPSTTLFGGTPLSGPQGLAMDAAGNLYIADTGNNRVVEYSNSGVTSVLSSNGITLTSPARLAVLPSGSVLVTDAANGLTRISAGNGQVFPAGVGSLSGAPAVAVDQLANVYIADTGGNQVLELRMGAPLAAPVFPAMQTGTASATQALTAYNFGTTGVTFTANAAIDSLDPNFNLASTSCNSNLALTPDQSCTMFVVFTPRGSGTLGGVVQLPVVAPSFTLVSNSVSQSAQFFPTGTQYVGLAGTGLCAAAPAPYISVSSGTYSTALLVTMSDCVPKTTFYYTVDGTTPTTQSTKYTGFALQISTPLTLQVIGQLPDGTMTPVSTATYAFNVWTPTFQGSVSNGVLTLTINDATPNAQIYYTTDGSTPTATPSELYTNQPITIQPNTVVNAIAVSPGGMQSGVATTQSTVNYGALKESIDGFGATTAFLGAEPTQAMTALFGTTGNGIGLNILRVSIDPTGSAPNWNTPRWDDELLNATNAKAANPNTIVFATPWSPPISMKSNATAPFYGVPNGCKLPPDIPTTISSAPNEYQYCGGDLDRAAYSQYAAYLQTFADYFASKGVPLSGISIQNEPTNNTYYESAIWTATMLDEWIANYAAGLNSSVPVIMPEDVSFRQSLSNPTLNDPVAVNNIKIVGGHLYGAKPTYYSLAETKGLKVWSTEHFVNTLAAGQPTIDDALNMAQEIHNAFAVGDFNAYVWWRATDARPNKPATSTDPGDIVTTGLIDTTNQPNAFGYAMGQFARFVLPGYKRATAPATPSGNVYVTTYAGGGKYVIVAINANTTDVPQTFTLQGATITSFTPTQTSSQAGVLKGLQQLSPVTVSGGSFSYLLPAKSITTFVSTP